MLFTKTLCEKAPKEQVEGTLAYLIIQLFEQAQLLQNLPLVKSTITVFF